MLLTSTSFQGITESELFTAFFKMLHVMLYLIYTFDGIYKATAQETILTPLISVKPSSNISAGNNITILCDGAMSGETVVLYRNGREFLRQQSDGSRTEFTLVDVSLKHQGNYFCMMTTNSRLSSHTRITVLDQGSISLSITPMGSIFLGSNVKLQCNGTKRGETVNLYKNGDLYKQKMARGSLVEFPLRQVDMEHEGSYFCKMSSSSKISNKIDISIEEELYYSGSGSDPLNQGSISLSITPMGSIFLGSNVKLQCNGTKRGETVNLYKNGDLYKQKMARGSLVEFPLRQVDMEHEGSYFCKMSSSSKISNKIDISIEGVIEEKPRDYTTGNTIRISLAGVLLVVLMIVVSEYFYSRKKRKMQHNSHVASNQYELN